LQRETNSVQSTSTPQRRRKNTEFWRACRYLGPYRRIVIVSIVCAFFVGGITAAGVGAMLPILQVLLNNETLQGYVDRQIVNQRVGVVLDERSTVVSKVKDDSPGALAGLKVGDNLAPLDSFTESGAVSRTLTTPHGPVTLALPPPPWYRAIAWNAGRTSKAMLDTTAVFTPCRCRPVSTAAVSGYGVQDDGSMTRS